MFATMLRPGWVECLAAIIVSAFVWHRYCDSVRASVVDSMRRFSIYSLFHAHTRLRCVHGSVASTGSR